MSSLRILALTVLTLALGCQNAHKKDDAAAPPVSPEKMAALRETLLKAKPTALVGQVIAVLSDLPYAAIGDLPSQEAKVGQTVSFVDGKGNTFATGTIYGIEPDSVHVKYDTSAKRPPEIHDLAVVQRD